MGKNTVLVAGAQVPEGCRCIWVPSHDTYGAEVRISWIMVKVEPGCPMHGHLKDNYPIR